LSTSACFIDHSYAKRDLIEVKVGCFCRIFGNDPERARTASAAGRTDRQLPVKFRMRRFGIARGLSRFVAAGLWQPISLHARRSAPQPADQTAATP